MTYRKTPAITPAALSTDPDVAVARMLGTLTARLARQRDGLPPIGSEEAWREGVDRGITLVIDTLAPLIPEYRGRSAQQLLQEEGAVRLIRGLATCEPRRLGRQCLYAMVSVQLSRQALQLGAAPQPLSPCAGVLDTVFDPTQRRAVRRLVEHIFENAGAGHVRIDFAAAWRTGSSYLIRVLDRQEVAAAFKSNGPVLFALIAWLFLADCWAVRANPASVAYLLATQLGYERWQHGTEAYRAALAEALVVATREDVALDGLEDVASGAWAGILSGELLDWAGSILLCFRDAMERPGRLARFRVFDFVQTLERAGKRGRRLETIEEHLVGLAYRVVRLDADEGMVRSDDDPGHRIPEVYELRGRIANARLTRRERQVLALRAQDLDFPAIGRELHISPATARVLMLRVRRSMGIKQLPKRKSA